MLKTICDNEQEYSFQQRIKGKLLGQNLPIPKSQGALFVDMVSELKSLKEDLISWKIGKMYLFFKNDEKSLLLYESCCVYLIST